MTGVRLFPLVAVCVLFLASSAGAQPTPADGKPPAGPALPVPGALKPRPGDDPVRVLKIERHNALAELLGRYEAVLQITAAHDVTEAYMHTLVELTNARVELDPDPAGRIAALKRLVEKSRRHEQSVLRMTEQGALPPQATLRARIARLEAEIKLAEATAATPRTGTAPAAALPVCPPPRPVARR